MWNKHFLKQLIKLALPIMLQGLFTVLGNTITTLMTGQLGDIPLAAIGLTNQLYFILTLVSFGIGSGSAIFTAQLWGKKNSKDISRVLGVSVSLGLIVGTIFTLVALLLPETFLRLFTTDEEVIALGINLLRIVAPSFLITPITYIYSLVLRSTGNVRLPMQSSIVGVILNILLGYMFIFGKLGVPALGAQGAAYANLTARILEGLLLVYLSYYLKTPLAAKIRQMLSFDRTFLKKVLSKVFPVMVNELLWSVGISTYSAIFARISTEAIASISIKTSIEDLVFVPFLGIIHACSIIVGNAIGSGKQEESYNYVRQSSVLTIILGAIVGSLLILGRGWIASLYNITDTSAFFTRNILAILGAVLWLRAVNTLFYLGMMRSGGDTRFAYWMDVGAMWLIGVPSALLAAFVFDLPVYYVYLISMSEEVVKLVVSLWRFRSRRWIHNLVST
jgi:putative MATE family efflux protein